MSPNDALHIVVASGNPVKARAVEGGFHRAFPNDRFRIEPLPVDLGAADQPTSDVETLRGAEERARAARSERPSADFWVGVEGGIAHVDGQMAAFAWIVVDAPRGRGRARTGTFFLPEAVAALVQSGLELGVADDRVFGRTDSKLRQGAVGLLTRGAIDRTALYEDAVVLALIPFLNAELFGAARKRISAAQEKATEERRDG